MHLQAQVEHYDLEIIISLNTEDVNTARSTCGRHGIHLTNKQKKHLFLRSTLVLKLYTLNQELILPAYNSIIFPVRNYKLQNVQKTKINYKILC